MLHFVLSEFNFLQVLQNMKIYEPSFHFEVPLD